MKATIEQIADRANQLSGSMSHGNACYAACRELGVEESEVPATASIVSTEITNREISAAAKNPGQPRTLGNLGKGMGKLARRARRLMREGHSGDEVAAF